IKEMHRQVGDLTIDGDCIATKGLLVRHLVLPDDIAGTAEVVRFLTEEISGDTYLNLMAQYRPEYNACSFPELDRPITLKEYRDAVRLAANAGLMRGLTIY
ncbi:MAG: radical SAM protein, partial [Methanotrichaceae archaeon]